MLKNSDISFTDAARALKILGHEGRLAILYNLTKGSMSVTELISLTGLNQSNLSQHLGRMKDNGILSCKRDGHQIYYSIEEMALLKLMYILNKIYQPLSGIKYLD